MRLLALLAALGVSSAALAANVAGTYTLKGTNPGGSGAYEGTVIVKASGDTYDVTWTIGGVENKGTGILEGKVFSVAYMTPKGDGFGLAVYALNGDKWIGKWTGAGGKQLGTETWNEKK